MQKHAALLKYLSALPALYEPGPVPFWDDAHISKGMLSAHINPEADGASRKFRFMARSADWIATCCGGGSDKKLLDLGCGPGLYAELLAARGFCVTGIDFSRRSIDYAEAAAQQSGSGVVYRYQDYLSIDFADEFDAAILIYCDFGVLSDENRRALLCKIHRALKQTGVLILDAWSPPHLDSFSEGDGVQYADGGFFSPEPHALLTRNRLYRDGRNTLEQYIVVTESDCRCYHVWNQVFTKESLEDALHAAGFSAFACFDDAAGAPYTGRSDTICIAARK